MILIKISAYLSHIRVTESGTEVKTFVKNFFFLLRQDPSDRLTTLSRSLSSLEYSSIRPENLFLVLI